MYYTHLPLYTRLSLYVCLSLKKTTPVFARKWLIIKEYLQYTTVHFLTPQITLITDKLQY